nr:oxidoreductase [Clavibacter sp. VKM Ac-2873]
MAAARLPVTAGRPAVAVVGPGAIGTSVAAALHEAGVPLLLCGRTARERLALRTEDGTTIAVPGPVRTDPAGITAPVDLVLLAVKATQVEAAAPWLRALCHAGTVVVVLQNGIEQVEDVAPHVPGCAVVPAVVWFPAEALADGSVLLRGTPRLTLPDVPASRVAVDALAGGRCRVELAADFTTAAWRKLVQNAVAGIMAATGRRAGVFRRDDVADLARAYARECLEVARAEGAVLDDGVADRIVDDFRAAPADQGTSILADRVAGRPLEWAARNGVILRRGRALGLPMPIGGILVPLLAAASDGPG